MGAPTRCPRRSREQVGLRFARPDLLIDSSTSLLEQKKPGFPGFFCFSSVYDDQAANNAFIFFSALASIWRIRSAETPYSSAKS